MKKHVDSRRLRILQSVREVKKTTNPYLVMLIDALKERSDLGLFTKQSG